MTSFGWREKLEAGKRGEEAVLRWLGRMFGTGRVQDVRADPRFQARDIDFVGPAADTYELKTDYRAHETGNLFVELEALQKSEADWWLVYIPQRGWVFQCFRGALLDYALEHWRDLRTVNSHDEATGRTWQASGIPIRMTEFLLNVPCVLYTRINEEEAA